MKIAKRLLSLVLALVLCLSLLPTVVSAIDSDFIIRDGVLTKYTGSGGAVVIPDRITRIDSKAFYNCTSLTSVTIPDSVTSIGSRAFQGSSLTNITIPSSVKSIGEFALSIDSLTSILVNSGNLYYSSIDGVLYNKDQTSLLVYPRGKESTTFIVPDSVTRISAWSYYEGNLKSISIPDSVTVIGEGAFFSSYQGIKNVYYGGSVDQWNSIAIDRNNSGLTSATIYYNSYNSSNSNQDVTFQKVDTLESGQFIDVPASSWYSEYIQTVYEYGLMSGISDKLFNPDGNLTVAEAIAIASRLHSHYYGNDVSFISGSSWYQPYVDYALNCNIIDTEYNYNSPVTRADFAVFISNALPDKALPQINEIQAGDIPDLSSGSPMTRRLLPWQMQEF